MKPSIPHPYVGSQRFQSLEDLRRAVVDLESTAREFGVHPDEVLFSDEFMLSLHSSQLSDSSRVLNLTMAIAPAEGQR
ncbi:MAG: hypothetical protein WB992_04825 [Bryobacteraceae bacterium]